MSDMLMLTGLAIIYFIYAGKPPLDAPLWLPLVLIGLGALLRAVSIWRGKAKDSD